MTAAAVTACTRGRMAGVVAGLHIWTLVLVGLHLYVRTLPPTPEPIPAPDSPEALWWGLWPVTYVPPVWFWAGVGTVLAALVWSWWGPRPLPRGRGAWLALAGLAGLLVVGFFAFPIAHTRWGDAYILSQAIAWPDPALRLTHSWQAPLDVFLHSQVWLALGEAQGWTDAVPVYRLLSPVAGMIYLAALLMLARLDEFAPGLLLFGLGASLGCIQLFFGYVENYAFAAAGILLFLWLGIRAIHGRTPVWAAALVLGITNGTHPSTAVLGPALLYVGWAAWQRERGTSAAFRIVGEIAVPILLCAGGTVALMEAGGHGLAALTTTDRPGGGDASWFVPLWATRTRWEAYTLLSWPHLRDLLNQLLLVAPVALPALVWLGVAAPAVTEGRDEAPVARQTRIFLGVAAVLHLLLIAVWNPDYGGQRDWDLFSLAWIPTTLWCVSVARAKLDAETRWAGFLPLVVIQVLHTAAWIYQNTLPWSWPT